ncbi:TRAP transporter small permease subunit [Roseococcus sp. YIM B11640]|uniref:TRAP transporter small permease subunit n=1 Tax=Roseococcus sp. YIM B11640 TaxID=3133973 RepID=UPI003C797962
MPAATLLRRGVSALAAVMAWVAGWNYVMCALFITGDIVGRNVFGVSSAATVEITGYMLACGIAWALAHTLACRAHIRVDVLVTRLPLVWRAPLHLFSLCLLTVFAAFVAWAGWQLYDESALFDAHDNSALHIPLVVPQGIWLAGLVAFLVMTLVLLLESVLALLTGKGAQLDRLLGSRTIDDEAEEALEAVAMAREGAP